MSTAYLNVKGMEEIEKKLEELGNEAGRVKTNAVKKGREVFKEEIKANIIEQGLVKSGALRDSIKTSVRKGRAKVGIIDLGDAYYGIFHEFGTSILPARPFVGPAAANKFDEAMVEISNYLKEVLL